jgi:hypothetical protein
MQFAEGNGIEERVVEVGRVAIGEGCATEVEGT